MNLNERIHRLKGGCKYTEMTVAAHLKIISMSGKAFLECPYCKKTFSSGATEAHIISDYLNDDTETLKALIEIIINGIPVDPCDCFEGTTRHATFKKIPAAIWLAWCEWMEAK